MFSTPISFEQFLFGFGLYNPSLNGWMNKCVMFFNHVKELVLIFLTCVIFHSSQLNYLCIPLPPSSPCKANMIHMPYFIMYG